MPDAILPIVIDEERFRTFVTATIVLPEVPLRIETPVITVQVDRCRVGTNVVFIAGQVVINIPFKTGMREVTGEITGTTGTTGMTTGTTTGEMTGAVGREIEVVCGDLRHCTAFVPFTIVGDLQGVQQGDECEILQACVLDRIIERLARDRIDVTVEICIRVRITRTQTVNVQGTFRPTSPFTTFPTFG